MAEYTSMTEEQIDLAAEIVAHREVTISRQAEVIAKMREALLKVQAAYDSNEYWQDKLAICMADVRLALREREGQ